MLKKAQMDFGIITFVAIVIMIFMLGPILLKVVNSTLTPFNNAINTTNSIAGNTGFAIHDKFVQFWDYVLVSAFLVMVILMFLSAFLIDTHPAFMILYIIVCFLMALFLPSLGDTTQTIWDQYPTETNSIPMTQWLLTHISAVVLCMMILSGIIMYAKLRSSNQGY